MIFHQSINQLSINLCVLIALFVCVSFNLPVHMISQKSLQKEQEEAEAARAVAEKQRLEHEEALVRDTTQHHNKPCHAVIPAPVTHPRLSVWRIIG